MPNDFVNGYYGGFRPVNPDSDPWGMQQFSGQRSDGSPTQWNVMKPGAGFVGIPYRQTYGGHQAPYADSGAQILDSLMMSGVLPGYPENPLNGNRAGRYQFARGLLGGTPSPTPSNGGGSPVPPMAPPMAPPQGGPTAPPQGPTPGAPGYSAPGSPAFADQARGYGPASGYTPTQEQLAQIFLSGVGSHAGQNASAQLLQQMGFNGQGTAPLAYRQLMNSVGAGSMYNPSRTAAVSQIAGGATPQQVMSNPLMGAGGGNYYDMNGNPTGANPHAATGNDPNSATSLTYLQQIAGLLGGAK